MEHETFWTLLFNLPHWEFELFLMFLFDGVIGLILWPLIRQFFVHHRQDDDKIARLERQMKMMQLKLGMTDDELNQKAPAAA
jgi:hypothetical protein